MPSRFSIRSIGRAGLALIGAAALLAPGLALADDLVASTLPGSRAAEIGETVTVFATMINTSGKALDNCSVTLSGYPVTVDYTLTNPATNIPVGPADTPFPMATGAVQTLVLSLTPSAALAPTNLPLVFGCEGAQSAQSLPGLDTVLLSAGATQPADVIALAATPSNDGVVRLPGIGPEGAFVVATFNVGSDATLTVTPNTGGTTLPLSLSICQTDPTTGACLSPAAASVTLDVPAGATPTFAIFVGSSAPVPYAPATTRIYVDFTDSSKVNHGATSLAVTNGATVATAPTGGGIYLGSIQIATGPATGTNLATVFIVSESGQLAGATAPSLTQAVTSLFTGTLSVDTDLNLAATGSLIAGPGFTLPDGGTTAPMAIAGTLSPQSYIAGSFIAGTEEGALTAAYNAGLYERAVALSNFTGNWNMRDATSVTGTVVFQSDGSFAGTGSGTNNAGCSYNGQVTIPNGNFNAESVTLTISGCALAGSYSGLATLYDFLSPDDTVIFGLSSGSQAAVNRLTRF
jgi:hypothetical protein